MERHHGDVRHRADATRARRSPSPTRAWQPEVECFEICSNAWSMFISGSLKDFINTGVGQPYTFEAAESLDADDHEALHKEVADSVNASTTAG